VDKDIVLVEINDLSIRQLHDGYKMRWPWPRVAVGLAIDFLHRGGARVAPADLSFIEPDQVETYVFDDPNDKWSGRQSDSAMADWARAPGHVVMPADAPPRGVDGDD